MSGQQLGLNWGREFCSLRWVCVLACPINFSDVSSVTHKLNALRNDFPVMLSGHLCPKNACPTCHPSGHKFQYRYFCKLENPIPFPPPPPSSFTQSAIISIANPRAAPSTRPLWPRLRPLVIEGSSLTASSHHHPHDMTAILGQGFYLASTMCIQEARAQGKYRELLFGSHSSSPVLQTEN